MCCKRKYTYFILLTMLAIFQLCPSMLISQRSYTKDDVRDMFPSNTKNLWINYLSGTFDNKHATDMIIGTDGHTCKGLYTLRSSNTTFFFDGEDKGKQLKLAEMNGDSRFTGFLNGNYDGEVFDGSWMDKDKNITLPVHLSFVNAFENFTPNKKLIFQWNRIFSGEIEGQPIRFQLTRNQNIYGIILTDDKGTRNRVSTQGKGSRVEMIKFEFENSILSDKWIMLDTSNLEKLDIIYANENGYEVVSSFQSEKRLDYQIYEYADFHSRLECISPTTGSKRFDTWMTSVFKKWLDDNLKELKSIGRDAYGTTDRWIQCAHGWVEVSLFDGILISGTVYMQTSWNNETAKIPFIYDLRYGREINLQDIFDNKFDSKEYFRILIPDLIKAKVWSPAIKSWAETQSFNHISLREEGIGFSTPYSTIYGEKEIVIPYNTIEQNLKPRYILK